jgi:hypothetical protein
MMYTPLKNFTYLILLIVSASKVNATERNNAIHYQNIINSQCDFILDHQLDDGAFTMSGSGSRPDAKFKICPYFSNIAAKALLEVPTKKHIDAVKRWMLWYMKNLNKDGSIDDYYATNFKGKATLTAFGDFDSIDSYSATFITLARKLCEVSPKDSKWLKKYSSQIVSIGNSLALVIDDENHVYNGFSKDNNNGLTVAKPKYKAKYTMDNAEVNEGMKDMIWLSKHVIKDLDEKFWEVALINHTNAFEKFLWDAPNNRYFMYEGGKPANWDKFYADATCQLYPIWCAVIKPDSERAKNLWSTFNSHYAEWQHGKTYGKSKFPWAVIVYTASVMKDNEKVSAYLTYIQSFTDKGKQAPYWYNLEAAFVILAAKNQMNNLGIK